MYSADFREAVVNYHRKGNSYRNTCSTFGISQTTLSKWLKKSDAGTLADSGYHGTRPKIDRDALKTYVDRHPDAYQRELAEEFGCSQPCICYNLAKIGYTFKKKTAGMPNRTR